MSEGKGKTDLIRDYLQGLVDRGELDLFRSVPNSKLREWARDLKQKYGQDFNVHTIATVLRELRIAESYRIDRELAESAPNALGSGSSGDALTAWAFVGGAAAVFVGVVAGLWYWSQSQNK